MTKQKGGHGEDCDVLVIGSLLGGRVAALELTEKGDGLRISALWRKRSDESFAETTWDIERFVWPPRRPKVIQCIYLLAEVVAQAGVGIGSRVLQRIRNSRPSTDGARTVSTDSEAAASVMPTASSSNTMATIYSIAERARRN
jgi:choline dehydrogenase-like flavoprotein